MTITDTTTGSRTLEDLRAQIDSTDDELMELLARRMRLCREVAETKRQDGIPMMATDRLGWVRTRARDFAATHGLDPDYLTDLYDLVTLESCRAEDEIIEGGERVGVARRGVRLDHVAVAVRDLESAISSLCENYGFEVVERRKVAGDYSGMDTATLKAGTAYFVLCQGDTPASNVSRYVEAYGPGVQHVAIAVREHETLHEELLHLGADLLTGIFHAPGLDQSFTRRDPNTGLQLEFITRSDNDGFDDNNVQDLFAAMEREGVF